MLHTKTALSYKDTEQYAVLHHSQKAFVGQMVTVRSSTYTCSGSASGHFIDEYLHPGHGQYLLERSWWLMRHCGWWWGLLSSSAAPAEPIWGAVREVLLQQPLEVREKR